MAAEPTPIAPAQNDRDQVDLERLRDRTDEIELIISGLTTFTLFTLPGWLVDRVAEQYTHLSLPFAVSTNMLLLLLSGLCYTLAGCFALHLLVRAYWVGLIGLRTAFPRGVNWEYTPGVGPQTRDYYRGRLPDLPSAIQRADRLASSIFAIISVVALACLWIGSLLTLLSVTAGLVGARFGATNNAIGIATGVAILLLIGAPLLGWLLDARLAAYLPRLRNMAFFRGVVHFLARVSGWLLLQRHIMPVLLTLLSNSRPLYFLLGMLGSIAVIVAVGALSMNRAINFSISSEFTFLTDAHVRAGFRSVHYEDMLSPKNAWRPWPSLRTFEQRGSHLQLFLPYWPLRDNLLLQQLCPGKDAALGAPCLTRLWELELNGRPVDLGSFIPGERFDVGRRGLLGWVPLAGLEPGLHHLKVTWNPLGGADDRPLDDRYTEASSSYRIPFLFAPEYELELAPPAAEAAPAEETGAVEGLH